MENARFEPKSTMAFSTCSFYQLAANISGGEHLDFLRDASDLVELPRIFTENRRHRAQSEVLLRVALCQQKRAYVPAATRGPFDCGSQLAAALKTLVVGAEALVTDEAPLPRDVVEQICWYV